MRRWLSPLLSGSVHVEMQLVGAVVEGAEEVGDVRMIHRLARVIGDEVLLGHVGDVEALIVFGQQVIE